MPDTVVRPVTFRVEEGVPARGGARHWIPLAGRPPQWDDSTPGITVRLYRIELESLGHPELRRPIRLLVRSGGAEDRHEGIAVFGPCGGAPDDSLRMDFDVRR